MARKVRQVIKVKKLNSREKEEKQDVSGTDYSGSGRFIRCTVNKEDAEFWKNKTDELESIAESFKLVENSAGFYVINPSKLQLLFNLVNEQREWLDGSGLLNGS